MATTDRFFSIMLPIGGITDTATVNSGYQTGSSYAFNIAITGANRLILISVSMLSVIGSSVTSIDVGGSAASLQRAKSSAAGAIRVEIWKLVAPPTGASVTITVTLSTTLASAASATVFNNVDQSTPIEASNDATATNAGAADATVDLTTISANAWVYDDVATSDTAITVGAGQLQRTNITGAAGSGASSTEAPVATPGSVTMSWTNVAALATWTIVAVALKPFVASASTTGNDWPGFQIRGFWSWRFSS